MNSKFIIYVLFVQLFQWTSVESKTNIYLRYHYETKSEVIKPICMNKDEYAVPEGEEAVIYVEKVEEITFAYSRCTLQRNTDIVTSDRFHISPDSDIYVGKLNHVISELYNCSFYILKEEGKHFEPTAVFNNVTYVRISCIFKLQVYPEKPILLTADVDGEILKPSKKSIDNVIKFEYKYSKEKELMVTCKKNVTLMGIVELTISDSHRLRVYSEASISRVKYRVTNPWLLEPYFTIKCVMHDFSTTLEVYNIHFTPKRTDGIDVEGLTTSNIIEDKHDKRLLYYKYTYIEEINLICSILCQNVFCRMKITYKGPKKAFMNVKTTTGSENNPAIENKRQETRSAKTVNSSTLCKTGEEVELSHLLLLTPADNSSVIECADYHNLGSVRPSQLQFIQVTLYYVDEEIQQYTTLVQPKGCFDGENKTGTDINCTSDWPNTLQTTSTTISPTILSTNSSQSPTASDFPKYIIWLSTSVIIIILAAIVLIVYRNCKHRRRPKHISQRPQLPLPESMHLDTFPNVSENNEEHEYEVIPEATTRPVIPNVRQLRRIPDMRLDRQNGRLIVKGKAINLQKLLQEAEYVETK